MKLLLIGLTLLILGFDVSAQSQCDFLKDLKFRNGRDTIVVKAVLRDFLLAPPRLMLKRPPGIYKYRFGSNILFQPENCSKEYQKPVLSARSVDKENILNGDNLGITIYLTLVVFDESVLNKGEYDCLIIQISRSKPVSTK